MNPEKHGIEPLFYDTYALYALAKGVESYRDFAKGHIIITFMNVYELYFILLRENKNELAEQFLSHLWSACVTVTPEIIRKASRIRHSDSRLSYVDALGYATAIIYDAKFLTGDGAFKDKPRVLFVK